MDAQLTCCYEKALRSLDQLLHQRPPHVHDRIEIATEHLVEVRDQLIAAHRRGEDPQHHSLERVNALLSLVVSAEFPLVGVRWKRIESARDELARLTRGD